MKQSCLRAGVLISGTGSNLKALINAIDCQQLNLKIVRVVSNRGDAAGIKHAKLAGIPVSVISKLDFPERQSHDNAVADVLQKSDADLVILAGYMRILGEDFTNRYCGRLINLHPSLLPLYKGLDTYNRVLQAGDSETGASIHFVNADLDSGAVISQVKIPVLPDDDALSLRARLGPMEHRLLVATVKLFCNGLVQYGNGAVLYRGREIAQPLQLGNDGSFL